MNELNIVQIMGFLIGCFFVYKSYRMVKDKKESLSEFFFWTTMGFILIILSAYLDIINHFLGFINMTSRINFLFSTSALVSLFLIFMIFKEIRNIKLKISKLNEEVSIKNYQKNK